MFALKRQQKETLKETLADTGQVRKHRQLRRCKLLINGTGEFLLEEKWQQGG